MVWDLLFVVQAFISLSLADSEVSLCPADDCEDCLSLDGCTWCYGDVKLITGTISWGYCYKRSTTDDEWCNLDSGTIIKDSCMEIQNNTRNATHGPSIDLFHDEACPFNSCGMCANSAGCSWCYIPSFKFSACLSDPLSYELNAVCHPQCVDKPLMPVCEHIECSSCLSEEGCDWCTEPVLGLNSNSSYGYCVPAANSTCHSMEVCNFPPRIVTVPQPPKSEYSLIANPFEDPCTQQTTCSACISSECGWCRSPNGWGECRGISTKKNGEFGAQFCAREGGFWLWRDCDPSLAELLYIFQNYKSENYRSKLEILETHPIDFNNVHIIQNLPKYLQLNFFSTAAPSQYAPFLCDTFLEVVKSMGRMSDRKVNCSLITIDEDTFMTQIYIYSRNFSSSGNVLNLNYGLICIEIFFLFYSIMFY